VSVDDDHGWLDEANVAIIVVVMIMPTVDIITMITS